MMKNENLLLKELLEKYTARTIDKDEFDLLLTFLKSSSSLKDVERFMEDDWNNLSGEYPLFKEDSDKIFQGILEDPQFNNPSPRRTVVRRIKTWGIRSVAAAAAVLAGFFIYIQQGTNLKRKTEQKQVIGIVAGGNKAILTLANGKKIVLDQNKQGVLLDDNTITYTDGAPVDLKRDNESSSSNDLIRTISTPNGGTYQITLSDGTKIWLNAATTLTCSSDFETGKYRQVSLEGEAYFEVAKNKKRPFIVKSKNQTVKVLGTHFNISSYKDDRNIKTTLLEGSVEVNNTILKPNEQSIFDNQKIKVLEVDGDKAIAWKNGKFVFHSEGLESIMKKLARWYNVEVDIKADVSDKVFTGSISRNDNISKILEKISYTQAVKFKIEGRRITVMP
ncbi:MULTISPECIES: FecR family protein [Sphingobacterium]|uniref:FecR family protein n=1 Tax=Sphingobacterium TaxID=28453 RepID=UPI00257E50ED|nr:MULTISPECIES: FecR family protein [Sphingobacterium]